MKLLSELYRYPTRESCVAGCEGEGRQVKLGLFYSFVESVRSSFFAGTRRRRWNAVLGETQWFSAVINRSCTAYFDGIHGANQFPYNCLVYFNLISFCSIIIFSLIF